MALMGLVLGLGLRRMTLMALGLLRMKREARRRRLLSLTGRLGLPMKRQVPEQAGRMKRVQERGPRCCCQKKKHPCRGDLGQQNKMK